MLKSYMQLPIIFQERSDLNTLHTYNAFMRHQDINFVFTSANPRPVVWSRGRDAIQQALGSGPRLGLGFSPHFFKRPRHLKKKKSFCIQLH